MKPSRRADLLKGIFLLLFGLYLLFYGFLFYLEGSKDEEISPWITSSIVTVVCFFWVMWNILLGQSWVDPSGGPWKKLISCAIVAVVAMTIAMEISVVLGGSSTRGVLVPSLVGSGGLLSEGAVRLRRALVVRYKEPSYGEDEKEEAESPGQKI